MQQREHDKPHPLEAFCEILSPTPQDLAEWCAAYPEFVKEFKHLAAIALECAIAYGPRDTTTPPTEAEIEEQCRIAERMAFPEHTRRRRRGAIYR